VIFLFYFFSKLRNGGPALATALAGYFNVTILFILFRLRFGRLGTGDILISLGKIAVCSTGMGALCWTALRYSHFSALEDFLPRLVMFVALIAGAVLTYLALAWVLRCDELREFYGIAMRREAPDPGKIGLAD
jgi:peptidoglycan biosynthesis protein MviN/MurJ (putative lipid II flippase)